MRSNRLALAIASIVLVAPAVARADSTKLDGTFRFKGDVGGKFDGKLVIESRADGSYSIHATESRDKTVEWSGSGKLDGKVLTIVREKGIVEALDKDKASDLTYVATFDDKLDKAAVRVLRGSAEVGSASLEAKESLWKKIPGELLSLARDQVDKAVHKEIDLTKEFDVLSYGHIGIKTGFQLLPDSALSPLQKESNDTFRAAGKGEPLWIRDIVQGGPRVAYSTSIPLDSTGSISLSLGFSLGGQITYTVDDQYTQPTGFKDAKGALDVIEDVPARVFNLPLSAARAEELPEGARRELDGDGSLALSGGISFGYRLEELGALKDKATVGLNGGASVTWNIHGDLSLQVERQKEKLVRVHWMKGATKQFDAGVQALLGFYVSDTLLAKVKAPADKVVNAVVKQGESYTTVEFNASADWLKQNQLDIDMVFDLADPSARAAYERAVQGDLLAVQALADSKQPGGLKTYTVTSTLTDALSFHAKFSAFKVLSASTDRKTTNIHVEVETLDGAKATTDTFDYDRTGSGLFGDKKSLSAEAMTREVVRPNQPSVSGQRVDFKFSSHNAQTWHDEMQDQLRLGVLLFGMDKLASQWNLIANDHPDIFHHYGASDMTLEVELGSSAIEKVLSVSYDDLLAAYGRAHWEKGYRWTAERVAQLRATSLIHENDESQAQEAQRLEAWDLYDAEKVLKLVMNARKAGAMKDRVAAFRDSAKKDGFALRAVVAFALIAGQSDVHVAYTLKDSNWMNVSLSRGAITPVPAQP